MARILWSGKEYTAEPVEELPSGNWRFRVHMHGPRWAAGSVIEIAPKDIIEMAAAEIPGPVGDGTADLEAGMAQERRTLTPVQELIAAARQAGTLKRQKQEP